MSSIAKKSFSEADEVRTPDKSRMEVVALGAVKVGRITLQPGWSWAACIKPMAGTDACEARHVGTVQSGHLRVTHVDGSEADLVAGDAYVIEPGHDASVVGDEPFVTFEFETATAESYAAPQH